MNPSRTELVLWAAGFIGHIVLLLVLFWRRRAKEFPFFTAFIADNIVRSVILYFVSNYAAGHTYLVTYVSFAILDQLLRFCIVYELASHLFFPSGTWPPGTRKGAGSLIATGVVIALGLTILPIPPEKTQWKMVLDRSNLFSSALLCELFLGMIVFSVTADLPWKTHVARIAEGLGFYSFLGLITESGHNVLGMIRTHAASHNLTLIRETAYLGCVAYWAIMLWREAPSPREMPEKMRKQLFTLQMQLKYDLRKIRLLK